MGKQPQLANRAVNAFATVGRVTIGLQGILCIIMAVLLLIVGGIYLGTDYPRLPAVVSAVECEEDGCAVAVKYVYNDLKYQGTLHTSDIYQYSEGDTINIRINPADPTKIQPDTPLKKIGFGMVLSALGTGVAAWYILNLVADDRNVAALGGVFSILQLATL